MKYTTKIFILFISMGVILFNSCIKEKYSTPAIEIPKVDFVSTLTIAQLKTIDFAGGTIKLIGDTIKLTTGDTIINPVIQGIVSADDESGNIYKTLYLQDNTGGIQIAIDKTSLYTIFKRGQRVFVKLKGLYMGTYGGLPQIGYIYGGAIGRMPEVLINSHIFCDSLPGAAPVPLERTIGTVTGNDMNMLVRLKGVHFKEAGSIYSPAAVTTNRTLYDSTETVAGSIILRNSGYANFRAEIMPKGQGDIVGILSSYTGSGNQFYIRDLNDIENWDSTIIYPINLVEETFTTSLGAFTQYSVLGTAVWTPSSYGAKMSGYSGGYFANEDWLISPSLNFNNYNLETLSFTSSMNYGIAGDGSLKLYTSTDYSGTGDPYLATWTEITPLTLSPGSWTDTPSGNIDLSSISGTNVHFAFKYTCTTSNVSTWEIMTLKLSAKPN